MSARTTVVFGGTGFLGRAIVRALTARGDAVRVAARRPDAAGMPPGVERFIHISGIGVTEASPSRYVRARARGELKVNEAFPGATILRPSVLFGPDDSFLATLDNVTRLPVVPLFGRGDTRLQPVHVGDVAAAVAGAAHTADAAGRVFELGGNEVLRYREIVWAVLAHRRRWRPLLPVPWTAWRGIAHAGKMLSNPPLTIDQVVLMQADNIVSADVATLADLGIEARGLRASMPGCLPGWSVNSAPSR